MQGASATDDLLKMKPLPSGLNTGLYQRSYPRRRSRNKLRWGNQLKGWYHHEVTILAGLVGSSRRHIIFQDNDNEMSLFFLISRKARPEGGVTGMTGRRRQSGPPNHWKDVKTDAGGLRPAVGSNRLRKKKKEKKKSNEFNFLVPLHGFNRDHF